MFRLIALERRGRISLATAVAVGTALVPAGASADRVRPGNGLEVVAGKRILLANDDSVQASAADGADGRGLYILRKALCEAKADVVVVGPWKQQSGAGRGISTAPQARVAPPIAIPEGFAGDCSTAPSRGLIVGACASSGPCTPQSATLTPADAVELALNAFLPRQAGWAGGPDLVLSGTNSGANSDIAVNMSGTVGAATMAAEHGVPAVAVSASGQGEIGRPPSDRTYEAAAAFATKVAARLLSDRRAAERLGREKVLLNINVPDVRPGASPSPRWTRMGRDPLGHVTYVPDGAGGYRLGFSTADPAPRLDPRSDTAALRAGHISIGAISVNRTAEPGWVRDLALTGG
ncbi:5'/3'-nucleotidase SurE [Actinomadura rugatobispora]|uniref:5'-nucleotidase n=1 Tax=Actinomadura rugatobispora TaxID=1994 RepID=A0ABW1A3U5_9ACTN|nr:5'/3'-nucleotidase SurE [Actinomadura rugatobispora]